MIKRIGILTSGGDCAGLNAVLRAATYRAVSGYGWEMIGIRHGTHGLLQTPAHVEHFNMQSFDTNLIRQGGTILGTTNKGDPFAYPMEDGSTKDRSGEIIQSLKNLKIDALIGIGGDGSLAILHKIMNQGNIPFIGIPKTIDNDLGITERSIGFDTAVEVATEALDRLEPTAASHDRVLVLEVMGRDAGHIALSAGIAGGADVILIPEIKYSMESIAKKIKTLLSTQRNYALVVVAEAVKTETGTPVERFDYEGRRRYGGIGHYIADKIEEITGAETRCTVLGHVQRGCPPTSTDRVLASTLGVHAVDLIAKGKYNRVVGWMNRDVIDVPFDSILNAYQAVEVNGILVRTARGLGICLGD